MLPGVGDLATQRNGMGNAQVDRSVVGCDPCNSTMFAVFRATKWPILLQSSEVNLILVRKKSTKSSLTSSIEA
jgi:hypothetical protein